MSKILITQDVFDESGKVKIDKLPPSIFDSRPASSITDFGAKVVEYALPLIATGRISVSPTTPGPFNTNVTYVPDTLNVPYPNFGGNTPTKSNAEFIHNGSAWTLHQSDIDFTGVPSYKDFFPDYLPNKNLSFSTTQLTVIGAVKRLNALVAPDEKDDNWRINFFATNALTFGDYFDNSLIISNVTKDETYFITHGFNPANSNGITVFNVLAKSNSALKFIYVNIHIDWSLLPSDFESFVNIDIKVNQYKRYGDSIWNSKTVLWLGTSIPEGAKYPELACLQNGALCINNARGSSMMRVARKNGTYNGLAYLNLWKSLGHTYAEKQNIIDNWSTIRPTLLAGAQGPATLSSDDIALIHSCSYENLLLPYLDGTHAMPDLFVIDAGYNDNNVFEAQGYETYNEFVAIPATRDDKNTFIGAFNWIVDLILRHNPRARIAISGHYENQQFPRVAAAQQVLANYWSFPILKLWEKTGWSNQMVPGSKAAGIWDTPPYNAYHNGYSENFDIRTVHLACPDGVHPHSDTSGKSQELLSEIAGKWLSEVF